MSSFKPLADKGNRKSKLLNGAKKRIQKISNSFSRLTKQPGASIGRPTNVTRECSLSENLQWEFPEVDDTTGSMGVNNIFQMKDKIGEGTFASVFIATNTTNGIDVAVKRMDLPSGTKHKEALRKEIHVLRTGSMSEYLVNYFGSYEDSQYIYLVMEYCSRGSLHDVIKGFKRYGSMSEPTIRGIVISITRGLVFLHSQGIIHRDLKTQNILIDSVGQVRLADFGVAALLKNEAAHARTIVGTPLFMAPEVLEGKPYTGKADVWSLGIVCITLAEGNVPRRGRSVARLMELIIEQPPPTLRKPQMFSEEFVDFVKQSLVKEQSERPTSLRLSKHPWINDDPTPAEETCAKLRHRTVQKVAPKVGPKPAVQVFASPPKRKAPPPKAAISNHSNKKPAVVAVVANKRKATATMASPSPVKKLQVVPQESLALNASSSSVLESSSSIWESSSSSSCSSSSIELSAESPAALPVRPKRAPPPMAARKRRQPTKRRPSPQQRQQQEENESSDEEEESSFSE